MLSHIRTEKERQILLHYLKVSLKTETGRLILSVPNRHRRFKKRQQEQQSHEITYSRSINNEDISFYYYLYDAKTLTETIERAGLTIEHMVAESIFPENWVTRYRLLGWLDRQLCKITPPQWGYGILVSCRVNCSADTNN